MIMDYTHIWSYDLPWMRGRAMVKVRVTMRVRLVTGMGRMR